MKKILDYIKNVCNKMLETETELEPWLEEENTFINKNDIPARNHLTSLGWKILSNNNRILSFSYTIQKGEHIHTVSIREALEMQ